MLDLRAGPDLVHGGKAAGQKLADDYIAQHYHQPSDNLDPAWDLSGAVQDAQLMFEIGYRVAEGEAYPAWLPGGEFRAVRDEMLARLGG